MQTVAQVVRSCIQQNPIYCEALGLGIANYSALARLMRKEVESIKLEPVSEESIAVALKRLSGQFQKKLSEDQSVQPIQSIGLTNGISLMSYERSSEIYSAYGKLLNALNESDDGFLHLDQGMRDMSILVSEDLLSEAKKLMAHVKPTAIYENCTLLNVRMPRKSLDYPGVCARYFRLLAWHQINLISFFHSHAELIFVLSPEDALDAQRVILEMLQPSLGGGVFALNEECEANVPT